MLRYATLESVRRSHGVRNARCLSSRSNRAWRKAHSVVSNHNNAQSTKQSDFATIFRQRLAEQRKQDKEGTFRNEQRLQQHSKKRHVNGGTHQRPHRTRGRPQQQQQQQRYSRQQRGGEGNRQRHEQNIGRSHLRNRFTDRLATTPKNDVRPATLSSAPYRQREPSAASSIRDMLARTTAPPPKQPTFMSERLYKQPRSKPSPSIRDMLAANTATAQQPNDNVDMTDVSRLREVFLKSVELRKNEAIRNKKEEQPITPSASTTPAWRRDGAKGFRKRLQQQQREQKERLEQQRRMRQALNRSQGSFFMTQEDYIEEQREVKQQQQQKEERDKTVTLPQREMNVAELSALFRVKMETILGTLKSLGERPTDETHVVDLDVMELVAMELGLEPVRSTRRPTRKDDKELLLQRRAGGALEEAASDEQATDYESFPPRPPVVCIMGHVDHGKTTLMDALRKRSKGATKMAVSGKKKKKGKKAKSSTDNDDAVAGTEAGGITQVISAFQVPLEHQENAVTFLDTPGHAAFRAMRESGSNAADVIVLVVAADDGVSPQTVEIIDFYKSIVKGSGGGGISMVVAMTKIDKHGIDATESRQRIENQLLEHGILSESFGSSSGEYGPPVQVLPVSGLTGEGLDDLIEGLVLQSEVMDLRADEKAQAEGIIMDARVEKGVGVVADCIVRWGSLERGDVVVSGVHSGKVKALKDMAGAMIKKGSPSQPVRILGFKSLPKAGEPIVCVASEEVADQIIERREALQQVADQAAIPTTTEQAEMQVMGTASKRGAFLEAALAKYGHADSQVDGAHIRIPVIIRADGEGSLAALRESLVSVGDESTLDLIIDPISAGIGAVSASDVRMAKESGASIFSFGVKQNDKVALSLAEAEEVEIRSHDVIYSLLDQAKEVFATHLPPVRVEVVHGKAKVQAIFDVNNKKDAERIAGLAVLDGILYKDRPGDSNVDCRYRVLRRGECLVDGDALEASSLRKVKEDVDSVRRGEECGLGLLDYTDFEKGDIIECYSVEMKREFV